MLYENFYMIFTGHSASKIWWLICTQDSVKSASDLTDCSRLHYQINLVKIII